MAVRAILSLILLALTACFRIDSAGFVREVRGTD